MFNFKIYSVLKKTCIINNIVKCIYAMIYGSILVNQEFGIILIKKIHE